MTKLLTLLMHIRRASPLIPDFLHSSFEFIDKGSKHTTDIPTTGFITAFASDVINLKKTRIPIDVLLSNPNKTTHLRQFRKLNHDTQYRSAMTIAIHVSRLPSTNIILPFNDSWRISVGLTILMILFPTTVNCGAMFIGATKYPRFGHLSCICAPLVDSPRPTDIRFVVGNVTSLAWRVGSN